MRALEEGEELRLDERTRLRITCLFGVVWITRPGDPVDHFLSRGESLELRCAPRTLIAGFTPAVVSVKSLPGEWARLCKGAWLGGLVASLGMRRAPAKHRTGLAIRSAAR